METKRECGSCTACCKTHPILELKKPAGVWCENCNINRGCNIYGQHPPGCKEFSCQWLLGQGSEGEKPNLVRIVTDLLEVPVLGPTFMLFEVEEGAIIETFATTKTLIENMNGFPVCHRLLRGKNKLFVPRHIKIPAGYYIQIDGKETEILRV